MITVDEVFPVDIRASIGPAGTMKRLFQNRDYFKGRGYDMTIFANHYMHSRGLKNYYELREMTELPKQQNYANVAGGGKKKQLISRIKKWTEDTRLGGYLFLKCSIQPGRDQKVQSYIDLGRRPDIIVFHGYAECYYYLTHKQADDHAKVACFFHSDGRDLSQFHVSFPRLEGTKLMRTEDEHYLYVINHIDQSVFISKLAETAFMELHPDYDRRKVSTAVNGIDDKALPNVAPSCEYKYRICTSGSVCQRKGQYIIVEAMKRMNPDVLKDTHLTVMGVGEDYDKLVRDVNASGLDSHITFLGNVPNPEMHGKLRAENIYCLMSNNEGLPIAIVEALRAGLPVISTRIAGIPETVDERNGILIDPDINQLTEVLNRLPEYDWEDLGKASRKRFEEEFTFQRMLKDYADMFDKLNVR